ncbi:MAG: gliding motility protein GldD [Tannerella sp.]|nr:gliding motility protein GldD [Tannerella sp.]
MTRLLLMILVMLVLFGSCRQTYTPKPVGLLRIDLPRAAYRMFNERDMPYSFEASSLAEIELPTTDSASGYLNIVYPSFNARIYCSYHRITPARLESYSDDCRRITKAASEKGGKVMTYLFSDDVHKVHAVLYAVEGDTPSPVQFMVTDSAENFFRGALYYENRVETDSVRPVTDYIVGDAFQLLQTFRWNYGFN